VRAAPAVLCCLLACRPSLPPPTPGTLVGLELPLAPAPSLRLLVEGRLDAQPALVALDPGQPASLISLGCGLEASTRSAARVTSPFGGEAVLALVRVETLRLGGVLVTPFQAGLVEGAGCRVELGDEVLKPLALEVHLAARTVRLLASRPLAQSLAALPPGDEVQVLPVAREPRFDWPLVTVRVTQGLRHLELPLLFSAREPWTRLYEGAVRAAGLLPGRERLGGLALPAELALPEAVQRFQGLGLDRLELAPGAAVEDLAVELEPGEAPRLPQGVLGADVWGRFEALIDLSQGVVLLHRPRLHPEGCERGGEVSLEACFQVVTRPAPGGFTLGAATWRPLPDGARLLLDLTGVEASCRVGLSFPPGDRGRSLQHVLPWGRLTEGLPGCPSSLASATALEPGLLEDGPLEACPGLCAFAHDLVSGRLACECEPVRRSQDADAQRTLRGLATRYAPDGGAPPVPEPSDPRD
jgi:hypothetical protein